MYIIFQYCKIKSIEGEGSVNTRLTELIEQMRLMLLQASQTGRSWVQWGVVVGMGVSGGIGVDGGDSCFRQPKQKPRFTRRSDRR